LGGRENIISEVMCLGLISGIKRTFGGVFGGDILGLDIGSDSIKLVKVDLGWGQIMLENMAVIETPQDALEDGELVDVEEISGEIDRALARNDFEVDHLVTAISGEQVISRIIEVPNMPKDELKEAVKWEAKEQIPISIEEGILDFEILSHKPDGNYQLLVIVVKEELVNKYIELADKLGLGIIAIETEPAAIGRVVNQLFEDEVIGIIDIGLETTDISVVDGENLLFTRMINMGGADITKKIAEKQNISFAEAQEYKEENNLFTGQETKLIIENLTRALYRSLDYFEVNHYEHDVDRVILTGGGSKLMGLPEHLADEFDLEVNRLDYSGRLATDVSNISNNELADIAQKLTVSIGLGLRKEGNR
jgi:type IV pilus assembly protein PilM